MPTTPTILISTLFEGSISVKPNLTNIEGEAAFNNVLENLMYEDEGVIAVNAYGHIVSLTETLEESTNDPNDKIVEIRVSRRDFDDYFYDFLTKIKDVTLRATN